MTASAIALNPVGIVGAGGKQIDSVTDADDGKERLSFQGKVEVTASTVPVAATPQQYSAESPLDVTGTDDTDTDLPDGKTLTIQSVGAGSEVGTGGSVCEVFFLDAAAGLHLVARIFVDGETKFGSSAAAVNEARDGTPLLGDTITGPSNTAIRLRRRRLGGGATEMDLVVRGYTQ